MKVKSKSEIAQSCPTLSDPMDCSLPGSSVHGICQARVLEWAAIAFSERAVGKPNSYNKIPKILLEIWITLIDFNSPCIWESSVDWVFLGLEFLLLYDIKGHCTWNKPETSICEKVLEKYTNIWKEKI